MRDVYIYKVKEILSRQNLMRHMFEGCHLRATSMNIVVAILVSSFGT